MGYLGESQFINEEELQLLTFSKNTNSDTVPHIPCVINSCVINCSTILLCFNLNIFHLNLTFVNLSIVI